MRISSSALVQYIQAIIGFAQKRLLLALFLLVMIGLTEGVGLLMLVPFLSLLGVGQEGSTNIIVSTTEQVFSSLNLSLTLSTVLILYIALITFRSVLIRWREILLSEIRLGFVDHLRGRLYEAIGKANWVFLSKKRTSDLTHVLTSDINRIASGTHSLLGILVTSFIALVYIGVAIQLSWVMTLLALASGAVLLLLLWPQVRKAKTLGQNLTKANRNVFGTVSDFLDGIKLAKSYAAEERYSRSFSDSLIKLRTQLLGFTRSNSFAQMMFQIGAAVALSGLLYISAVVIKVPGAELLVLIIIFSRLLPLLSSLQSSYQQIVHMLPAFTSAMQIQQESEAHAEVMRSPSAWQPIVKNAITLDKLAFRYNAKEADYVLHDISIAIPANHTLGIVGPSGAGKSTLADIYAGLIEPNAGTMMIDGHKLLPDDYYQWRKAVAYVPQETFLFHDSIRNNLLWANPNASEEELNKALKLAAAETFVSKLPQGLDTVVGDRGIRLSGGERQRIALARALLAKPLLLILDEATSALDTEHERQIQQAIENLQGELTIIIIAHRLSTIQHADQIVVIEDGRVIEKGTWDELMLNQESKLSMQSGHQANER